LGAVAALFAQLALGRRHGILAGLRAAPWKLPRDLADEMAILADQEDPGRLDEGEHADRHADRQDRIDDLLAVRQPPGIFAERELAALVQRRRRQTGPGCVHRPMISSGRDGSRSTDRYPAEKASADDRSVSLRRRRGPGRRARD